MISFTSSKRCLDAMARCRWSAVIGDSAIFAKHNYNKLNLIDVEKKELLFKASVELEKQHNCK